MDPSVRQVLFRNFGPKLRADFTASTALPPWITFSRPSLATLFDSTGKLTYCPNNLLLNTASLSTQNVTTAPINYIVSFIGTGTITLSGTSTDGPLVGTGANDRVYLAFTPTAGTLTLTVSGSVTLAQLEAVTYQTAPSAYNATTSAAYYGPRFDYDPVTLAPNGLLIEEARTNLFTTSSIFSSWTAAANTSVTNSGTAPDGTTGNCWLIDDTSAATFGNVSMIKAISGTGDYTISVYAKAGTSSILAIQGQSPFTDTTGYFDLTGVTPPIRRTSTGTPVALTSTSVGGGWYRVSMTLNAGSIGSPAISFAPAYVTDMSGGDPSATPTGSVYLFGAQFEAGSFPTSYIPTAASSVARSADVATLNGAALTVVRLPAASAIAETGNMAALLTNPLVLSDTLVNLLYFHGVPSTYNAATYNTTTVLDGTTITNLAVSNRLGVAWSALGRSVAGNGGSVATDGNLIGTYTSMQLGSANSINGCVRSIALYNTRLPDAVLRAKSVVNAPL